MYDEPSNDGIRAAEAEAAAIYHIGENHDVIAMDRISGVINHMFKLNISRFDVKAVKPVDVEDNFNYGFSREENATPGAAEIRYHLKTSARLPDGDNRMLEGEFGLYIPQFGAEKMSVCFSPDNFSVISPSDTSAPPKPLGAYAKE